MSWKKTGQSHFAQGIERGYSNLAVTEDGRQDFFARSAVDRFLAVQTNYQNDPVA